MYNIFLRFLFYLGFLSFVLAISKFMEHEKDLCPIVSCPLVSGVVGWFFTDLIFASCLLSHSKGVGEAEEVKLKQKNLILADLSGGKK